MIATFAAASALLLAPLPATKAFALPSVRECVETRTLAFNVRDLGSGVKWTRVTVRVDGRLVKRVNTPRPARDIRVGGLPVSRFTVTINARTDDGRTATAKRTYHPCAPGGKPTVTVPPASPPTTLTTRDLVVGSGARARKATTAHVHYVLATWSDAKEVDSSRRSGDPFFFKLGAEMVIPGFDQGIEGMRVGGRREIVVPPQLGYGEAGSPPIGPNETLVFVVDLIAVKN